MVGDDAIRESFAKVKRDFDNQDSKISDLKKEINELRNQVVDYMPKLLEQNNRILQRLEALENKTLKTKDPLKDQLMNKYKKGKKEVIKQRIIDLSHEKQVTLSQLRDTIVKELGYCSRATFYRYFEELQTQNVLGVVTIKEV